MLHRKTRLVSKYLSDLVYYKKIGKLVTEVSMRNATILFFKFINWS